MTIHPASPTRVRSWWALGCLVAVVGFLGAWVVHTGERFLVCDEFVHREAILAWAHGRPSLHPRLAMLPGYHALLALAYQLGAHSLTALRAVSLGLAVCAVPLVYQLAVALERPRPLRLAAHVLFLPVVFPYQFLLYTDGVALTAVLACLLAALRGRLGWTAALGLVAVAIRQNSLVWVVFCGLVGAGGGAQHPRLRADWLRRLAPAGPAALGLALFVAWHGSLVAGDQHAHGGLHPENLCLGGALVAVFFPETWARRDVWLRLLRCWRGPALLAALVLVWVGLEGLLPYNGIAPEQSPVSRLALEVSRPGPWRLGFVLLAAAGWVGVGTSRFRQPGWRAPLLGLWLAFLLPLGVMTPRYQVIPLALFLLAREPSDDRLERLRTAGWVALSAAFLVATAQSKFLL